MTAAPILKQAEKVAHGHGNIHVFVLFVYYPADVFLSPFMAQHGTRHGKPAMRK